MAWGINVFTYMESNLFEEKQMSTFYSILCNLYIIRLKFIEKKYKYRLFIQVCIIYKFMSS